MNISLYAYIHINYIVCIYFVYVHIYSICEYIIYIHTHSGVDFMNPGNVSQASERLKDLKTCSNCKIWSGVGNTCSFYGN